MKKKDITFADKANKIISKYKLRLGNNLEKNDPLAKKAMERELDALKAEQDVFKQQQQVNAQQQQIANQFIHGQQNQMGRGGNLPQYGGDTPPYSNIAWNPLFTDIPNIPMQKNLDYQISNDNMPNIEGIKLKSVPTESISTEDMLPYDYNEDYIPYDPTLGGASPIPLIAQLASSAAMYRGANANAINYDRVNPEEIDLSSEREDARKRADIARLMALRNARGLGLNAGEVATLGTASQESIDSGLSSTLGKSYLNEALTNAQNRQRASQINANIGMRETDSRLREKDAVTGFRQQAIQDAINGTSKYFGDVQKGRQFNADQNTKNQVYGRFEDPNQGWLSRFINPQSIVDWRSPETKETFKGMYTQ